MNKYLVSSLLAVGLSLPVVAYASPNDDVTIRVMEMDEHSDSDVTRHIDLPDSAAERAREAAEHGIDTANRSGSGEREHEKEVEHENEREMERENEEHEMERESDEREMERESDEREMEREIEREDNSERGPGSNHNGGKE